MIGGGWQVAIFTSVISLRLEQRLKEERVGGGVHVK